MGLGWNRRLVSCPAMPDCQRRADPARHADVAQNKGQPSAGDLLEQVDNRRVAVGKAVLLIETTVRKLINTEQRCPLNSNISRCKDLENSIYLLLLMEFT